MRTILILTLAISLIFPGCKNSDRKSGSKDTSEIKFETIIYNFGEIPFEGNGRCNFSFTNSSEVPLIINIVRTSCGCTNPQWPEEPVKPGEMGEIAVSYDTKIKGKFRKSISVYSNAENSPHKLIIEGTVIDN